MKFNRQLVIFLVIEICEDYPKMLVEAREIQKSIKLL